MQGQFVHVEIPADDTAKGQEFWGGVFVDDWPYWSENLRRFVP